MLQFRIQSTPNPNARKYIVNQDLKADGKVSYQSPRDCPHVPMATALLQIPGISQVHFFANVLTVTQNGHMDWAFVDESIQSVMTDRISDHDINFADQDPDAATQKRAELTPELRTIDEILDRTIRPGLQMDGGDVEVLDLEGHILTVRYLGACGGCPSSMTGTLEAIKSILRDEYHGDLEVIAI